MRMKGNKISISEEEYDNNLYFYTVLKKLLQCKLSEDKMLALRGIISSSKTKDTQTADALRSSLLSSELIIKSGANKRGSYEGLVDLISQEKFQMWKDMVSMGSDLILYKDLILAESKAYTLSRREKQDQDKSIDYLSVAYDAENICAPYGQRVIAALLVSALTNMKRGGEFLLGTSGETIRNINSNLRCLTKRYHIDCNNILMLIVDESVNQSIKQSAGSSFENRVERVMSYLVDSWNGHSHDKNVHSMEYDFTFKIGQKVGGISAKRTLRERYKQNHEDVDKLEVDKVFVFTLGTDLNSDKTDYILGKKGTYIVVSDEVYNAKDYLSGNSRVISSKNLSRENLSELLNR